jgi:hypothetical protein
MKRIVPHLTGVLIALVLLLAQATGSFAACAKVSIEIPQELTVERTAFDARMVITNGIPDQSLQDIRVDVVVRDFNGNVKNDLFFVRPPTSQGSKTHRPALSERFSPLRDTAISVNLLVNSPLNMVVL